MSGNYGVMGDFLQTHAYANVWCTPNQDKQARLKPARLTPINGVWNRFTDMWRTVSLPDTTSRFHVYQIGQIHPLLLGLADSPRQWIRVSDACASQNVIVDIYTAKGYQLPRFDTYYMVTADENLIMAMRIQNTEQVPIDLNTEDIFVRLYKNAYYNSDRVDHSTEYIRVFGKIIKFTQDILDLQGLLNNYRTKPGACYCTVNGMVVDNIDLNTTALGDVAEFVYDASIKQTLTLPVTSLKDFVSDLDSMHKYLIHNPNTVNTIDYHDDVDFFLIKPGVSNRYKGLYYHRNNEKAVRMVTHKDYALPVPYVAAYLNSVPSWTSVDDLKVVVHIRKSGYERPLVFEANRIKDLYRMTDADALAAMVGLNATVDVWKAEELENSKYCALMRAKQGEITRASVQEAYGYNGVSKLVGDTPLFIEVNSNVLEAKIPVALQQGCTVYEYDENGLLLEWHYHSNTTIYPCQNTRTRLVEVMGGVAGNQLEIYRDQASITLDLNLNYRFYTSPIVGGVPQNIWSDVTDTSAYAVINGVVSWSINTANFNTLVLSSKKHLTYINDYIVDNGIINFTLREFRQDLTDYRTLTIPMGELDVFLNGRSLIRGLDYYVNFPVVVITNKEYLSNVDTDAQKVVVRHYGFCKPNMTLEDPADIGYVQYGVLSYNNRFDIRDDKVNRIIVDGQLYHPSELSFGEEDFDVHVVDARNGAPYAIRDIVVPMNSYLDAGSGTYVDPTYELRAQAKATDTAISNYLTLKIPEKNPTNPSTIPGLYQVYSPFFSRIIHDLMSGVLDDVAFATQYSDQFVRAKCLPYESWLAFDPLLQVNAVDHNYVIIHPHHFNHYVSLDIYKFRFLSRVVKLYGGELIDLSSFVNVAPLI